MAEKSEDCEISLMPRDVNNSAEFTLKVPNVFCLPEDDDTEYDMKSPCFEFDNATWRFQFQSYKKEVTENGDCIKEFSVYLERLTFEISEQIIFFALYLLNADDKRYKFFSDSEVFYENDNRNLMWVIDNDKPSYDTRNTLTLIIQLIGEATASQVPTGDETLPEDLKKLLLNGKHHDLTLKVADKEFRVHQDILMVRSQVFEAMLSHDMKEKQEGSIDMPDCEPECMEQFLFYVYSGKVEKWNLDNALGLYYLSDKYNMMPLKRKCFQFLKNSLSTSRICEVLKLALNHDDVDLLECATEYFLVHTSEILLTTGWISFVNSNSVAANELFIKASKKWKRDTSTPGVEVLQEDFKKLLLNGKHHDFTLKVADKEFRVHQDILMARSQVFEAMLSHDMTEKKEGSIDVPDCEPECMEQFLFYVYSGNVEKWNLDNAFGLYYLSDKYNMMPLKRKCSQFIRNSLSTSEICDVLKLALNHDDSDLLDCATEYFLSHKSEILPTVGWMSFLNSNSVAANELFIKASKKWDSAAS